ncbi:putative RNA-directed DNA polymerase from transposon BS [Stylophora pistillata]|uniref:Putative RNA-directed DNA polymerase from transposon BS n=1 Tax=Stylophora pistillata TaxID=50429 RepID=A0A2B4R789_STYPI|nr:putative RNA-directed DNA polymerase from transposon BS [Stylophora pistillata]
MDLENHVSQKNIKLKMVVDLTNTNADTYYNPKELCDHGIPHRKIKCVGKQIPDENVVERFKTAVCTFMKENSNSDSVVGVHCTHGVNRSGYVVCRYLIECKGYTPQDAIKAISHLTFVLGITENGTKFHLKRTKQTGDLTTSGEIRKVTTLDHVITINMWIVINHPQATQPSVDITCKGGLEANDTGKIIMDSYIKRILSTIKINKATGADGISPRLLKLAGPRIFSSLTKLINQCIVSGSWPTDWKTSIVSPIYKKGTETLKSNYRPVSVLSAVSKVAERVIFDQLYEFSLDFLSGNLSGFLKGHSCTTALLKTFEDIRKKLDSSEHSAAITIDLSKAFDSINHDLLLAKLSAYGVTKDALQLLRSYLTDRKQHVKTDGVLSDWQIVRCGVPQGSILGPLLFNIYMNDVNFSDISCSLRFYADDTTGYSSNLCPSTLQINLQNNVGLLASWFCENFLAINHSKSQSIVFNRATLPTPFVIDSNELDYVTHMKLLGVVIDNSLSFNVHIKEVCRKVNTKVSILRRIRKFIPSDVMIKLYKAFILPHFEYASPLFIGLSKGLSAKLESTNAFALRTLLNYSKSTAYEELLKTANIKSLEHRRIEQALILVYKSIHNQTPNYIQELFSLRSNGYSLRGHLKVVLPRPTSSYMQHSFTYQASKQWNNLTDKIRMSESLSIFRKNLQDIQLSSSYDCSCLFCKQIV